VSLRRRLAPAIALVLLLAGCSNVLSGRGVLDTGREQAGGGSTVPVAPPNGCPHVVYAGAKLSFDCVVSGMRTFRQGNVWPFSVSKTVEPATRWTLDEGAGHWGSPDGVALVDIALNVRQQMLDDQSYGTQPTVRTVVSKPTTVDGAPAYLVQTNFFINPVYARQSGTKVKEERSWILAIQVAPGDVSLWYVSLPDLVKSLWAKVPQLIDSIKVG
jgi:hypothetical protein